MLADVDILGLARHADPDVVRAAYRVLTKKYHPDTTRNTQDAARFREISDAYAVLSSADRRKAYDTQLADLEPSVTPAPPAKPTRSRLEIILRGAFALLVLGAGGFLALIFVLGAVFAIINAFR